MSIGSSIEWTEATWNPVAGCSVVSPGCTNCYAMRMAARLEAMGQSKYTGITRRSGGRPKWNGRMNLDYDALQVPYSWKSGRMIFVNSMSDLFHDAVPINFILKVFHVMSQCGQHTFQVLTKRSERLVDLSDYINWPSNVWMGVSVENSDYINRVEDLKGTKAKIKFLSLEPLIGDIGNLDLNDIDWVIAGGESGPGSRLIEPEWVRSIRDQCIENRVAFHFKQWGGTNKKRTGRTLDGRTWDEFPTLDL